MHHCLFSTHLIIIMFHSSFHSLNLFFFIIFPHLSFFVVFFLPFLLRLFHHFNSLKCEEKGKESPPWGKTLQFAAEWCYKLLASWSILQSHAIHVRFSISSLQRLTKKIFLPCKIKPVTRTNFDSSVSCNEFLGLSVLKKRQFVSSTPTQHTHTHTHTQTHMRYFPWYRSHSAPCTHSTSSEYDNCIQGLVGTLSTQ